MTGILWQSHFFFPDGTPHALLYRVEGTPIMHLPRTGLFRFRDQVIDVWLEEAAVPAPYILGRVFAFWLELRGILVLHGACLALNNRAVGFLGHGGQGKTTLVGALSQLGLPLLSDDLIPLAGSKMPPDIDPGIPISRMWKDSCRHFFPTAEPFAKVHPLLDKLVIPDHVDGRTRFATNPLPLAALCLIDRRREGSDMALAIEKLAPGAALLGLVGMSFGVAACESLGLQPRRLAALAGVAEAIPVFRLSFPSGWDHLDQVRRWTLKELQSRL